jgi:hypothetical protein
VCQRAPQRPVIKYKSVLYLSTTRNLEIVFRSLSTRNLHRTEFVRLLSAAGQRPYGLVLAMKDRPSPVLKINGNLRFKRADV